MKKPNKALFRVFKIILSLALMVWVINQLDWHQAWKELKYANLWLLFFALIFFIFSQWISVHRLHYFFHAIPFKISLKSNTQLYVLGMFYNFFIPGGIGGDAFKAYLIQKQHDIPLKKTGKALLFDRLSGLIAIGFWMMVLAVFLFYSWISFYAISILILCFLIYWVGQFIFLKWAKEYLSIYSKTFVLALLVQLCQLISVFFILWAMNVQNQWMIYLSVFLISVLLSVISFAGIGLREYLFMQAALFFQFNENTAAVVALFFTVTTLFVSFGGIFYHFKGLVLKTST